MQSAFFIVGPTAVGKTALAVELAERHGAEIVSADAYQVYRGFDLLTAKPTTEQQRRVAHHLVGYVDPGETYNVARFRADARAAIRQAAEGGRPVIVVGGNGLYVKALTHGLSTLPAPSPVLRAELEGTPVAELLERLRRVDPITFAAIDRRNARRVVRALEVYELTGKPFSNFQSEWKSAIVSASIQGVFLHRERTDLITRINGRVEAMFIDGVVDEVRRSNAHELSTTARQILGLAEIERYLAGQISLAECREEIKIATRQYAKRQVTWFRREDCFQRVEIADRLDFVRSIAKIFSKV